MTSPLSPETLFALLAPDAGGMLELVRTAPERGRAHLALGRSQPYQERLPAQILICGMGGSGSAGDLFQASCRQARIPLIVAKTAQLPAWVGPETLVIGISYSGNTFETLSCLRQAGQAGASLLGLASGGELAEMAARQGFPLLRIAGGLPPRAALFEMLFALLGCLQGLPALGLDPAEIDAGLARLDTLSRDWEPKAHHPQPLPLTLARSLADNRVDTPLLWGVTGATDAIALRWKNQFSENAKTLAAVSLLPELNHNEVVAMCARHHSQQRLIYLTLETAMPAADVVVLDLVRPHLHEVTALTAPEGRRLERLLYFVYLGDFCSVYLALLTGVDPTPIAAIDELKRRMA